MKKSLLVIWLILAIGLLVSCSSQSAETLTPAPILNAPTSPPTIILPTPSPTLGLLVELPTATPTQEMIRLADLLAGQYMVVWVQYYRGDDSFESYLAILSASGELQGLWLKIEPDSFASISHSGKRIAIWSPLGKDESYLIDTLSLEITPIESLEGCFRVSWSPDDESFVADCVRNDHIELYLYDLKNALQTQLSYCGPEDCSSPVWSPDGKWIAYTRSRPASGEPPATTGLYVMDTKCFTTPSECINTAIGPFIGYRSVGWSPDSKYLAAINDGMLIYEIDRRTLKLTKKFETSVVIADTIAWSPDGKFIAYSDFGRIY